MKQLWIFGYGSLMWKPGFAFDRAQQAILRGHSRAFCIYSVHHRGTAARPGLVLGLDRGGVCSGVAYRIPSEHARATLAYLREREQVTGVYRETVCPVQLIGGSLGGGGASRAPESNDPRDVRALVYLVERAHPQYAGHLPLAGQARLIRRAVGISGRNLDYLVSTVTHLRAMGIAEPALERVTTLAGGHLLARLRANGGSTIVNDRGVGSGLLPFGPKLNADLMHRFIYRRNLMLQAESG